MRLFPADKYIITSALSKEEAITALSKSVEPVQFLRLGFIRKENEPAFQGTIKGNTFRLSRIFYGRGVRPEIVVIINAAESGSNIKVECKLPNYRKAPFFICLFFSLAIFTSNLIYSIIRQSFNPLSLIILIFPVFAYLINTGTFWPECNLTAQEFERILEGEIIE